MSQRINRHIDCGIGGRERKSGWFYVPFRTRWNEHIKYNETRPSRTRAKCKGDPDKLREHEKYLYNRGVYIPNVKHKHKNKYRK